MDYSQSQSSSEQLSLVELHFVLKRMNFDALTLLLNWIKSALNWIDLHNDTVVFCRAALQLKLFELCNIGTF